MMRAQAQSLVTKGNFSNFRVRAAQRFGSAQRLFPLIVGSTVVLTAIYLYGICADRYVSEAQFIVRSISQKRIVGLDSILKTFGLAGAQDDSYAIAAYLQSRDALRELEKTVPIRDIFSRPEADMFSSFKNFWTGSSFESLYWYSKYRITVVRDANSGVTTLQVSTFRPEDSQIVAKRLIELGEQLANSMNARAQQDALRAARAEVKETEDALEKVSAEMSAFRNREVLVDPSENSVKAIELIGNLSAQLALNMAEVQETSVNSPKNPALDTLRTRSVALQEQINNERGKLAGGDDSLATKISAYESLALRQKFAEKMFASALSSLEAAQQDARRQQVYVESIVPADKPDEAMEPRRFRNILTVSFVSMIVFALTWVIYAGSKEHAHG